MVILSFDLLAKAESEQPGSSKAKLAVLLGLAK